MSNCLDKIINTFLAKTINEIYWFAAGILKSFSKNIFNQPCISLELTLWRVLVFGKNRSFLQTKKHGVEQSRNVLFYLYRKNRNLDLPIDCQLKLFDNTVLPMLLYGCENWAYGDLKQLEKVHTNFLKRILHVKQSTPHVMLYGDLGRYFHCYKKENHWFWVQPRTKISYHQHYINSCITTI